jgi:protein-S-isoprenylcysteine O-methyltransferase Ste14
MTQLDAKTNVDIAMATKDDGAAMKTIAIVTMLFLPATFVSALLGMNFFNFNPDEHGGHMTYSHDLWIYFLVSVVLTLGLFALWWVWQTLRRKKMASSKAKEARGLCKNLREIVWYMHKIYVPERKTKKNARFIML